VNLAFAALILATLPSLAELIPGLSVKGLANSADLIIVGKVVSVQQTGSGEVTYNGVNYPRQDWAATVHVEEVIEGEPLPYTFIFSFSSPSTDAWGNVAPVKLPPNTYSVIFLNQTAEGYKFVSPYYPSLPAGPKTCGPSWQVQLGEDTYHKVLQRVLDLLCADSGSEEKMSAVFALSIEDSSAAPFLKAALNIPNVKSDPTLRMSIVSDLLSWGDLNVLPLAEKDLFDQSVRSSFNPKSNLVRAISMLEPRISIPLLARVLELPQPEERLAAARFLEYTNSQDALDVLLWHLEDTDRQVQFAVMQSLGNLTKQHWWRPRTIDPDPHWDVCIQHWREFAAQRKDKRALTLINALTGK
jgi:hypothetical protein